MAILLLLLFCMAAGLLAQTAFGRRIGSGLDDKLGNPTGLRRPVMVHIEDAWQLGMDELENGLYAVYFPSVPEARSGSLFFMEPERVRPLTISVTTAIQTLRRMGVGSRELLKGQTF